MFVGAQVVNPEFLCPWFFGGWFAIEEQYVRLNALRVEDAGRQAEQGMNVGLLSNSSFHSELVGCSAAPAMFATWGEIGA